MRAGSATTLSTYGIPLDPISYFNYHGRFLLSADDNWKMVVLNLRRAHQKRAFPTRVFGREGADSRTSGMFYVSVVQAVLLYGLETWVIFPCIGRTLGRFHHRVDHRLIGRKLRRGLYGRWVYPPLAEAILEAVSQEVDCSTVVAHSTLRPGPLCTYIWGRRDAQVQGCTTDGGIRRARAAL